MRGQQNQSAAVQTPDDSQNPQMQFVLTADQLGLAQNGKQQVFFQLPTGTLPNGFQFIPGQQMQIVQLADGNAFVPLSSTIQKSNQTFEFATASTSAATIVPAASPVESDVKPYYVNAKQY
uniref:Uncharacterized protein n=1 Tax=Panagrolaimus sp. JU765 TaxID=591449 RepID=A0AC34QTD6_9BILA